MADKPRITLVKQGVMQVSKGKVTTPTTTSAPSLTTGARTVPNDMTIGQYLGALFTQGFKPATMVIRRTKLTGDLRTLGLNDVGLVMSMNSSMPTAGMPYNPIRVMWVSSTGATTTLGHWPEDLVIVASLPAIDELLRKNGVK